MFSDKSLNILITKAHIDMTWRPWIVLCSFLRPNEWTTNIPRAGIIEKTKYGMQQTMKLGERTLEQFQVDRRIARDQTGRKVMKNRS